MAGEFRFSFGPWNIHEGADPFGPMVRDSIDFNKKLTMYKELGYEGVQFHDDDAVPNMNDLSPEQVIKEAAAVKAKLEYDAYFNELQFRVENSLFGEGYTEVASLFYDLEEVRIRTKEEAMELIGYIISRYYQ